MHAVLLYAVFSNLTSWQRQLCISYLDLLFLLLYILHAHYLALIFLNLKLQYCYRYSSDILYKYPCNSLSKHTCKSWHCGKSPSVWIISDGYFCFVSGPRCDHWDLHRVWAVTIPRHERGQQQMTSPCDEGISRARAIPGISFITLTGTGMQGMLRC